MRSLLAALALMASLYTSEASNILVVCPFFGKSHSAFIHPIVAGLADRGHNITIITSNVMKNPAKNIRQIVPNLKTEEFEMDPAVVFTWSGIPIWILMTMILEKMMAKIREYIETTNVQDFLKEDNQFDLVVAEAFFQEAYYGFAHKYKTPLVLLATTTYFHSVGDAMGNPPMSAYLPYEFARNDVDGDILKRTYNHFLYLYASTMYKLLHYPRHQQIIYENFGADSPKIKDLEKNISVALFNTHFTIDDVRPLVPGIIEVGGVHLKPPNKLPKDLQKTLDDAKDGFIYFSLGSFARSSAMPKEKLNAFINVFGKLKQKVLWKWEEDEKPKLPDNVVTSKWFPQTDLLAHPNIKMFITHCGMLSTQELVNRGVPIIGVPVSGDQHLNMVKMQRTGMAVGVGFDKVNEENLMEAIQKILKDPQYTIMAKEVSRRFNDRPNTPLETSVFWIEYVIRNKGASFMRSRLATTSWFHSNLVDVYVAMFLIVFIFVYIVSQIFKFLFGLCKRKDVSKKKKKQQ